MHTFKSSFILITAICAQSIFANGSRPPVATQPPPAPNRNVFVVNPTSLRKQLLDENMDVIMAALHVSQAKTQFNISRAGLLPSVNLSTILLSAAQPTFLLSSIEVMFPFLLPSKWFEMHKAKYQLEADKEAFHIVQLNVYANIWALYQTHLNDRDLWAQLMIDAEDWKTIEEKTAERFAWGLVTQHEMAMATAQRALAQLRAVKVKELLSDEVAQIRYALGLELSRPLQIEASQVAAFSQEAWSLEKTRAASLDASPEISQLAYLEKSAVSDKWARIFGFIIGASASQAAAPGEGLRTSFDGFTGRGTANLGLAQFPTIALAGKNIDSIHLRRIELNREVSRLVETVKNHAPDLESRLAFATEAEAAMRADFERILDSYKLGMGATLTDVLDARMGIQEATFEKIRATTDISLSRISLLRLMRLGEFSKVDGCHFPVMDPRQPGALTPDGKLKLCTKTQPK